MNQQQTTNKSKNKKTTKTNLKNDQLLAIQRRLEKKKFKKAA